MQYIYLEEKEKKYASSLTWTVCDQFIYLIGIIGKSLLTNAESMLGNVPVTIIDVDSARVQCELK